MAINIFKKYSTSLGIKELQIKTILQCVFSHQNDDSQYLCDNKEIDTPVHSWWGDYR